MVEPAVWRRVRIRLIAAQGLDAATLIAFYLLVGPGVHAERNPLVLAIMAIGGIWAIGVVKVGLACWVSYLNGRAMKPSRFALVRIFHERHPEYVNRLDQFRLILASVAVASGIVGAGFNSAALIDGITRLSFP